MLVKDIRKVPGIGKVMEKTLNELGIRDCEDILNKRLELYFALTDNSFEFLIRSALGIGRVLHSDHREN